MPPSQDVRRDQYGEVAHVVLFRGRAEEAAKARQFTNAWIAAHGVGFLARQIAHHQRAGAVDQMNIRRVATIGQHRQAVETGSLKRLNFEVKLKDTSSLRSILGVTLKIRPRS